MAFYRLPELFQANDIAVERVGRLIAHVTQKFLLEGEGLPATVKQGHTVARNVNPTTGRDVAPAIRARRGLHAHRSAY